MWKYMQHQTHQTQIPLFLSLNTDKSTLISLQQPFFHDGLGAGLKSVMYRPDESAHERYPPDK